MPAKKGGWERLLGRAPERAALAALLADARAGRSGALLLRGEPGIGKTTLLQETIEQAAGMRVLHTRGLESEAELAFAGLAELLGPILDLRTEIPALQAASLAGALGVGDLVPYARFPLLAGTLSLLAAAAEPEPLLVVVDDALWLDAPSAEALIFVARRLRFEGIAMLLAQRPDDLRGLVAAGIATLDVHGLDAASGGELVGARRGVAVPVDVARELRAATGGNPLALRTAAELLEDDQLRGARPLPQPLPVGEQLSAAFLARVAQLPEATVSALTVLAAAGAGEAVRLGGALAALGLTLADLHPAEEVGLVDLGAGAPTLAHPLLRSALYQSATPARRREIHAALAAALQDGDERRAWHLAAAAVGPDEQLAADLERAAGVAGGRGGHMTAAALLERAAELSPDSDAQARRLHRAAGEAHLGGRPAWAMQRVERALGLAREPRLRAEIAHMRGSLEQYAGSTARARQLLVAEAEAIRRADSSATGQRLATLILLDAAATSILAGDVAAAHATATAAAQVASTVEGTVGLAPAALEQTLAMVRGAPPPAGRLGAISEQLLGAPDLPVGALWLAQFAINDLVFSEQYDAAQTALERMVGALRAVSAFGVLPLPLIALAELHFRTGRWISAYGAAHEAIEIAQQADELSFAAMALATAARIEAATGRMQECAAHAERAHELAAAVGVRPASVYASAAQGLAALGQGAAEEAIRHLTRVCEQTARDGVEHPAVIQWAPDLVEAHLRAGERVAAKRALVMLEARAQRARHTWALAAAARCRGLLDDAESGERSFAEALAWHARTATPFEQARTQLCLGERLRREGRRAEAREPLEAALATFAQLGAEPWSRRAREELGATTPVLPSQGDTAAALARLTSQELRVASVIAAGATNREAAAALFLSPKTVNAHLESIYRKLAIKRRSQLARILAQPG
ncbi:MAG TPA: AAA family ATPase [Solirubrobacteraceae bacterium]|nr:AAA family ATPase [Solirubrobacteraceae bacterium]